MQEVDIKKVLLTGVAGFIGNTTARLLAESGVQVVALDSVNDAYDTSIKKHRLESISSLDNIEFVEGNIENRELLWDVFSKHKVDAVLNLAARAGVRYSMENPSAYLQTNAQGTLNILEAMRDHDVKKMVLASTSSLYAGHPLPFNEEMPVNNPISPYAASKKAAEAFCHSFHHLYDFDISIVRYFTVYGPAGRPDMCIFRFIRWIDEGIPIDILGDGEQSRDFTYVDDVARGTIAALKPLGYEIINIGGGMEPVSLLEVISMLEKIMGKKATTTHRAEHVADIKETRAEVKKAHELLGWESQVGLEEGLRKTVAWYEENREWVRKVEL